MTGAVLAEVLIALALLIPVIVMVAGLFPYSFSVDKEAWNQRTAQSLARSALEEARGTRFDDLVDFERSLLKDGTTYRVAVRVVDVHQDPADPTRPVIEKSVTCEVSWPRKHGAERPLRLETTVAKLYQGLDD